MSPNNDGCPVEVWLRKTILLPRPWGLIAARWRCVNFLWCFIFRSMCFVVRNEMPTFAAESVRAFTTFEHTFFAFAIISRLAKSLGNSIGITSTTIICERCLVYIYGPCFIPISDAHAISVMQSYGMTGVPFRGRPVLNASKNCVTLFLCLRLRIDSWVQRHITINRKS